MKILKAKRLPNLDYSSYEKEIQDIDDWVVEEFFSPFIKTVAYWYIRGSYMGAGYAILESNKGLGWIVVRLNHCSCNSAWDNLSHPDFSGGVKNFEDLILNCSEEAKEELMPLIEILEEYGDIVRWGK